MKAILVIDINDDIKNYGGSVYHYPSRRFVHIDVPFKPMPEKKEEGDYMEDYDSLVAIGWNACLEEILNDRSIVECR